MTDRNISFAQNGEDIVLWRALKDIQGGTYIDVGANHPTIDSVSRKFYDAGWRGVAIEPNPEYASLYRVERPGDAVYEAIASDVDAPSAQIHLIDGTGLSTMIDEYGEEAAAAGWSVHDETVPVVTLNQTIEESGLADRDIHFLSVDTEGAEAFVLGSIDFSRYRPWILVIEATAPNSTRQVHGSWQDTVERAGYTFQMFDGLSRYYLADERAEQIGTALTYAASVIDDYARIDRMALEEQCTATQDALTSLTVREQQLAVDLERAEKRSALLASELEQTQATAARSAAREAELGALVAELQRTLSWRVTKPLRGIRSLTQKR
ncbi:FkbM family methyltransferase [Subtercola sp. RTI3]|uniref:FkbM family methyltransferase n=1 Tax=Subtercola sp. RTI3 TaxID=3048639 RepID=UPI002B2258CC|nr:FkbM family methyltransferase [Subtercola sp. RTI3]MEA9984409.1 FkbM family methyltransferase [Subtercola sp. RTI3]